MAGEEKVRCQGTTWHRTTFVPRHEVELVGRTAVHKVELWHTTTSGAAIEMRGGAPVLDAAGEPVTDWGDLEAADAEE